MGKTISVSPEGFEAESFPLKYNPRYSNTRSTSLKLIYIISSFFKPKIKYFKYFLPMHQVGKNAANIVNLNSELVSLTV